MRGDIGGQNGSARDRNKPEIAALTGLRGVAALTVVIGHVLAPFFAMAGWVSFQNAAVDIFFCLSGFTLCLAYSPERIDDIDWKSYTVARFARIYPLYLFVVCLAGWYSYVWGANAFGSYTPQEFLHDTIAQLAMVNAWPIIGTGAHWAAPLWSLSIEVFCYLAVFPILAVLTRRTLSWNSQVLACAMLALVSISYVTCILYINPNVNQHNEPTVIIKWQAHWVPIVRGITMFASGWLAYVLWIKGGEVAAAIQALSTLVLSGAIAILVVSDFGVLDRQVLVVVTPFLILSLMNERSLASRVLSFRPIRCLGLISFSIYALHWPIFFFAMVLFQGYSMKVIAIACVVGTALAAPVSYALLEMPARSGIKAIFTHRRRGFDNVSRLA